jgi:putative colanic acid biosynthesis acetyltransferase WcaF
MTHVRDPFLRSILWRFLGAPLFRASFHNWYPVRRLILRLFGTRLAPTTRFRNSVRVDRPWNLTAGALTIFGDDSIIRARAAITVGNRCVISQLAMLSTCAREPRAPDFPKKIAPITIEDDCWIAADALVLPGVTVHAGTVVGARSLVANDLPGWRIAVGEPARAGKTRAFTANQPQAATT